MCTMLREGFRTRLANVMPRFLLLDRPPDERTISSSLPPRCITPYRS